MKQTHRLSGGLIDRSSLVNFSFNNHPYQGHPGDTLASALLANGQRLVGRSFKYHRPRGVFSAGSEEPNALMTIGKDAHREPNTKATVTPLVEGLKAYSQNHRGSLNFDLMAINDLLSPFLSAGFYYKTFMWPRAFWEKVYEPIIRASAGLGILSDQPDPNIYDKGFLHCDILIIGAGASGLSAALAAGRAGARVILADEGFLMGGKLSAETFEVEQKPGSIWVNKTLDELSTMGNVQLLSRTTVFGAYDHRVFGALESFTNETNVTIKKPRQVLWRIYSQCSILCAGATERSIAFANNDRPGIMLAGAVRTYANRFAVTPGKRITIMTNNDSGWRTAHDLHAKGVEVAAIIDSRNVEPLAEIPGAETLMGGHLSNSQGRMGLKSITLSSGRNIKTDCLAVSGGWNPNVHLTCHHRGRPQWSDEIQAFVPGPELPPGMAVAGAANGTQTLGACLAEGHAAGNTAASDLGYTPSTALAAKAEDEAHDISAFWQVSDLHSRSWVDLQNDVTVKDIKQSHQEGFRSVEHLKRYTTLGMATDQGKTANVLALAILAECSKQTIPQTGTTIYRPPYSPISIGAIAGRSRGKDFRPTRLTPSHQWALEQGATFVETGMWLRAQWFTRPGETHWRQSVDREVMQTRASVGVCDVTTLGKIDIQGRDAIEFLNRIYANGFNTLAIGKIRYGLMLREDGIVMDDGTTARLNENHFVMTTTTANAATVFRHMEFCRQCLWPNLDVHLISATEQWAQFAVAGPNSRKLLEKIVDPEFDISNEAFPFMACGEVTLCGGTKGRLFRISFSGELAFEIAVPTSYGDTLVRALMKTGKNFDVVAYGTEALGVMRVEKGHAAGNELTGHTTARNLGMGKIVSKKKDCIGNTLSERTELNRSDGLVLVGFVPTDIKARLNAGAHFVLKGQEPNTYNDQGWMSSVAFSPTLNHFIGLGFIKSGPERLGEVVIAADLLRGESIEVKIVSPHFVDPEGERLRA